MAEVNQRDRTIRVKIVYYGPPLGGKTTNLRVLHERAVETRRGDMISINSLQDRTILFDLLPFSAVGPRGFTLKLQLLAVPGQALYAATRRAALKGADGIVFVANSAVDRWNENLTSFSEMKKHLVEHNIDPSAIPLALQYNKRDLPSVTSVAVLDMGLKTRQEPAFLAVASSGEGIVETFEAILARTLRDLSRKFRALAVDDPQQLARDAVVGLFGRVPPVPVAAVAGTADVEAEFVIERFGVPASESTLTIRVPVSEPGGERLPGASRSPGAVTEAYAEACTELATRLVDVKAERDLAQGRLEETRRALNIVGDLARQDVATTVKRMLACLAEAASATHASFVFVTADGFGRVVGLPSPDDPLLAGGPAGGRYLRALADGDSPCLRETAGDHDLGAILGAGRPPFASVASLPVQTSSRTIGLAILYFLEDEPLPGAAALEHLQLLASVLAAPLALAVPAETVRRPEPFLQEMALAN